MKLDQNRFFREVTRRISSSLEINTALFNLMEYLQDYMPIDNIGLYYLTEDYTYITTLAEIWAKASFLEQSNELRRGKIDEEIRADIEAGKIKQKKTEIYNSIDQAPLMIRRFFPDLLGCSLISLALTIEEESLGGLGIAARGENRFNQEHARLLEEIREPITLAMSNARRYQEVVRLKKLLEEDNRSLSRDLERFSGAQVIGSDFGLSQVMEQIRLVASSDSPVLLLGETGTGKEVIANAIHLSSPRRNQAMIRVQCGAIPETLLDSELFGHEKGAFTGAIERKRGRFERAQGGTIFLDEIAELSPEAQVKLLRVLQEKEFERVGGSEILKADVRVIAATHRDLEGMVKTGKFREDLWFRLNIFPIRIPPLRQRKEDIPSLLQYFIEHKSREMNLEIIPSIAPQELERLQKYSWPGNVRELQNLVERALILRTGNTLFFPQLGEVAENTSFHPAQASTQIQTLNEVMADYIRHCISRTGGKISGPGGAAELLGLNPNTLRSRMRKLGIRIKKQAEV